jgi:hypothetical protein
MTAPMYLAVGGVVFVREHQPITIHKARLIENIHRMNAAYQLSQNDERSLTARLGLAKIEQSLADEMAAAIREATQPEQKEAA